MKVAHEPLVDDEIQSSIQECLTTLNWTNISLDQWNLNSYLDTFQNWILSSSTNNVQGLDKFPVRAYSAGALESIVSFIHRHGHHRRLRFSRAEFVASKIASNHAKFTWLALEDSDIAETDAVILSFPFSGNGGSYPGMHQLLERASKLGVPVLLDMAYYSIAHSIDIDVDQPCITDVVFSLSKSMSVPLRLGIRFCRVNHDDLVQVNSDLRLFNRLAGTVGMNIMNQYSHDWVVEKYLNRQTKVCATSGITPSLTMTLATGNAELLPDYVRNGYCRMCITEELTGDYNE